MLVDGFKGFEELSNELSDILLKLENPLDILEIGAEEFVKDLLKLTKPYSKIRKSGYTHLVDSFTYEKKDNEIEVGWGKYYGRMVDEGTKMTRRQPHMQPTFEKNKEKYYKKMLEKIF